MFLGFSAPGVSFLCLLQVFANRFVIDLVARFMTFFEEVTNFPFDVFGVTQGHCQQLLIGSRVLSARGKTTFAVARALRRKGMTVAEAGTRLVPSLARTTEAAQAPSTKPPEGRAANIQRASRTPCAAGCPAGPARPGPAEASWP